MSLKQLFYGMVLLFSEGRREGGKEGGKEGKGVYSKKEQST